jgi:branched-chain amino acid transport system ATP-binding protein
MAATEMLRIDDLHAWYGESHVLHGVNMRVDEGEVVSVLGRNGAGRTTT